MQAYFDWDLLLSNVMEVLVACFEGKLGYRCMIGAMRKVSKGWNISISASLTEIEATGVDTSVIAEALKIRFTRVHSLVLHHCLDGINGILYTAAHAIKRLHCLEVHPFTLGWSAADQRQVSMIGQLTNLQKLKLWGTLGMTGNGLVQLSDLCTLVELSLGTRLYVNGSDLAALLPLRSLSSLHLAGCNGFGDVGLSFLGQMESLKNISLEVYKGRSTNTEIISCNGLDKISRLPCLQRFTLKGCESIEDDDLTGLCHSTTLQKLWMERCTRITDRGMAFLAMICSLNNLSVKHCRSISNQSLEALRALKKLKSLTIGDCWKVTDAAVRSLNTMTCLKSLTLIRCPLLTIAGIKDMAEMNHIQSFELVGVGGGISGACLRALPSEYTVTVDWHHWECHVVKMQSNGDSMSKIHHTSGEHIQSSEIGMQPEDGPLPCTFPCCCLNGLH